MKVAIINDTRKGPEVHAAGCADVAKSAKRNGDDAWIIEVASRLDMSMEYWADVIGDTVEPDSDEGWATAEDYISQFRFLPCCADLPHGQIVAKEHAFTRSTEDSKKCATCNKTRSAKAHQRPATPIEVGPNGGMYAPAVDTGMTEDEADAAIAEAEIAAEDAAQAQAQATKDAAKAEAAADEPTVTVWVGWRVADAAIAAGGSLGAKLSDRKPNAVLDRTVKLSKAESEALAAVATQVENEVAGTKGAGPVQYSCRTLRARLDAAWS